MFVGVGPTTLPYSRIRSMRACECADVVESRLTWKNALLIVCTGLVRKTLGTSKAWSPNSNRPRPKTVRVTNTYFNGVTSEVHLISVQCLTVTMVTPGVLSPLSDDFLSFQPCRACGQVCRTILSNIVGVYLWVPLLPTCVWTIESAL